MRLELCMPGLAAGEAWAPYSDDLATALDRLVADRTTAAGAPGPAARDQASFVIARGLLEAARLDAHARLHGVPLHVRLGGAIRSRVAVSLPLDPSSGALGRRPLERQRTDIRHAIDAHGVSSFSVHETSTDIGQIADTMAACRDAAGPHASLTLRLGGQLSAPEARALITRIRRCDVVCIADPCSTVPQNISATEGALPALALSSWSYDRAALLHCLVAAPPTVLFVDPLREGGIAASERLAAIARVLQVDLALTAAGGGPWLAALCACLAAVLPASYQPVELPFSWTLAMLEALQVRGGALTVDDIPRIAALQRADLRAAADRPASS
jgi:L-alanine-DL-glutamate epimerase-like enolase superfamily enzyme